MKVEVTDIIEDEIIKGWWKRIDARESTKRRYAEGTVYFFTFVRQGGLLIGKTPREVLEYARGKIKEDVLDWRDEIEGIFAEFEDWLKKKPKVLNRKEQPVKLAPKTISNNIGAVKSFFNAYNIDVPKRKGRREVKPLVENNHRLTKEIVREAIKYADVREKAIILTMMTSGMGDSEILNLQVDDFIRGREYQPKTITDLKAWVIEEKKKCEDAIIKGNLDYGITKFEIRRQKTTVDYITFVTPEASLAILDYLAQRNRESDYTQDRGRGRLIEEKRKIRSPDDYLFIKNTIDDWYLPPEVIEELRPPRKEQPLNKTATKAKVETSIVKRKELGLTGYADEIRKLDRTALMTLLRRLAKKAGVDTKFGVYQVLRGHNLRKLFYTLLRNEGVDSFIVEYWIGHKIPDEQAAYFEAIPEKLKGIYTKYMHVLFIGEFETKILAGKEYTELKEELDGYKEALKNRNGEIAKLREEIEELKGKEAKKEPIDSILTRLISDPEVQKLLKKKLEDLANS
jgi:integrase